MRWGNRLAVLGGALLVVACNGGAGSSVPVSGDQDAEAGVGGGPGSESGSDGGPVSDDGDGVGDAGGRGDAKAADGGAGCVRGVTPEKSVILNVTGRITFRGQPRSGLARFRERQSAEIAAEASVNDAGYFLLAVRSVYDPNRCGDYWIEITGGDGPPIFGERDTNDLVREAWNAASGAKQNVDISSTPIPVESTQ